MQGLQVVLPPTRHRPQFASLQSQLVSSFAKSCRVVTCAFVSRAANHLSTFDSKSTSWHEDLDLVTASVWPVADLAHACQQI